AWGGDVPPRARQPQGVALIDRAPPRRRHPPPQDDLPACAPRVGGVPAERRRHGAPGREERRAPHGPRRPRGAPAGPAPDDRARVFRRVHPRRAFGADGRRSWHGERADAHRAPKDASRAGANPMTEHVLDELDAYALGALDRAEAERVAQHLSTCASCRNEAAALAEVVGAIPDTVALRDPRPALRERLLEAARTEARSPARDTAAGQWSLGAVRPWRLAVAAVGAVVIVLGAADVDAYRRLVAVTAERDAYNKTIESIDRKSTRLNSSHVSISYAVFCLKK